MVFEGKTEMLKLDHLDKSISSKARFKFKLSFSILIWTDLTFLELTLIVLKYKRSNNGLFSSLKMVNMLIPENNDSIG